MKKFAVLGFLALVACQSQQLQQTTAGLESGLTIAERTALGYVSLPRCPVQAPVCSDPNIVAKIAAADNTAYNAVKAASAAVKTGGNPDIVAATAALSVLQGVLVDQHVVDALKGK